MSEASFGAEIRLMLWRKGHAIPGYYPGNDVFSDDIKELLDTVAILRAELTAVELGSDEDSFQ